MPRLNSDYKKMQEYYDLVQDLNVMDNVMMQVVFNTDEAVEYFLRTVFNDDELNITKSHTEHQLHQIIQREVILDVYAVDTNDTHYNIEIQNSNDPGHEKRIRFLFSAINVYIMDKSQPFTDLPKVFIIYVSNKDPLGEGRLVYPIGRFIGQNQSTFNDGEAGIYINTDGKSQSKEEEKLEKLIKYMVNSDVNNQEHGPISEAVRRIKLIPEERNKMAGVLYEKIQEELAIQREEYEQLREEDRLKYEEALEKQRKEREQSQIDSVKKLYKSNVPLEVISSSMNLPENEIADIVREDIAEYKTEK